MAAGMNKRVKRLWLKALRSGRYLQGQNWLRSDGFYCCLGVLCELYRLDTGRGEWSDKVFEDGEDANGSVLPCGVMRWAELKDCNPRLGRRLVASALNDKGKSFNFIADRIEKYL